MAATQPGLVDVCKDFVRSMSRAEQTIATVGRQLSKEDRRKQLEEIFRWLEATEEIPKEGLTRDVGRELIGQLTAFMMYDDCAGSTDHYIV